MRTKQTPRFQKWMRELRDAKAKKAIAIRIARMEAGLFGDAEGVGGNVSELKVHVGPGYRVYFTCRGEELVVLLCGGDKSTQDRDIARAKDMAAELD